MPVYLFILSPHLTVISSYRNHRAHLKTQDNTGQHKQGLWQNVLHKSSPFPFPVSSSSGPTLLWFLLSNSHTNRFPLRHTELKVLFFPQHVCLGCHHFQWLPHGPSTSPLRPWFMEVLICTFFVFSPALNTAECKLETHWKYLLK